MMPLLALAATLQGAAIDWDTLAPLPYRAPPIVTPEMTAFVEREAVTRKCALPADKPKGMTIDVAVLVDPASGIRTTVPRGIQCPTVEQYAAALVAGFARNNLLPRNTGNEQWYRTSLTFDWTK
jgi:hypothetical protein